MTERAMEMREDLQLAGEAIERQATANLTGEECDQLARLFKKILE